MLDDLVSYRGRYVSGPSVVNVFNDYYSYGQLNFWTGALGIQIAPNLGVGAALSFVSGKSSLTWEYTRYTDNTIADPGLDDFRLKLRQSYRGFDARLGLMYSVPGKMSFGLRAEMPQLIGFEEEREEWTGVKSGYDDYDAYPAEGRLESSYGGALGFSWIFPFMKTSLEIRTRAPHPDVSDGELSHWRSGGSIGAEVPLPLQTTLLRAGYGFSEYDAYPLYVNYYGIEDAKADVPFEVERGQHAFSGGLAYLTTTGISFELSYAYTFWKMNTGGTLIERRGFHRALASVSVRY
jgi:hypothetical protein